MKADFVSLGECMVELAPTGAPDNFQRSFAGDTFNTAWYARALCPDWRVRYVTAVGRDAVSDEMCGFMDQAGIDTAHVRRHPQRSVGLYMIALHDGERSFSYWRDRSAARCLAEDRGALDAALAEGEVLYFSGITLAILEGEGCHTLLQALAAARAAGRVVAFDPNLRPRLWPDTATMRRAVMDAARISDIILPSHEDEAVHFGDSDPQATLARYLAAGARTVIVKNGAGAIHYSHDGATGQVQPETVTSVVDTTAAGDSFNAGFFASLGRGGDVEAAIRDAARVAAAVIGGKGALVPVQALGLPVQGA